MARCTGKAAAIMAKASQVEIQGAASVEGVADVEEAAVENVQGDADVEIHGNAFVGWVRIGECLCIFAQTYIYLHMHMRWCSQKSAGSI